ncbi:hypothetical protein SAMN05421874_102117 [Nonomuraea maritima]|uniref:Uncharacterized protein n=1 Tax=Nonomuraea maritima TaxID=683260 RepID=A0A1G8UH31_9ACTN|nr:hypothetical protein [Nonomuraea maritima]SDJ53146.1 hypothetical protein SAMN05421874_102117 [Nonomuraea maritima]
MIAMILLVLFMVVAVVSRELCMRGCNSGKESVGSRSEITGD